MNTQISKFKYLKDAQCVRFDVGDLIVWHVFASEKDAERWERRLRNSAAFLSGVDADTFIRFRGVAVIHLDGPCTIVKLRNQTEVDNTWVDCTDQEEAEMRVLGRLADLRACEDFRNS